MGLEKKTGEQAYKPASLREETREKEKSRETRESTKKPSVRVFE